MRGVDHSEVALSDHICLRCTMGEVKTTAFMVFHAIEALDVMPGIRFRTFWICVVIVDGYSDTCSIVNNYFVFVLLPR